MVSWESGGGKHKKDESAFIFSIDNQKVYKVVNSGRAIYCNSTEGPSFGGCTLSIESDPMNKQNGCKTRTNGVGDGTAY
jgi:hypothetical protein